MHTRIFTPLNLLCLKLETGCTCLTTCTTIGGGPALVEGIYLPQWGHPALVVNHAQGSGTQFPCAQWG